MFSHGRGLTKLGLFYAVLAIPIIGPPIIAAAAIGLMLGGGGPGRELTDQERKLAIERNERRAALARKKRESL